MSLVEGALGEPGEASTGECGGAADKYGNDIPKWRCTTWTYGDKRVVFDTVTRNAVACQEITGTRLERHDPARVAALAAEVSGDPVMLELARMRANDRPYEVTVPVWTQVRCSSLVPDRPTNR